MRNWRARFKSEGIRLTKYLVGFAALFALVVVAPPLDTFGIKWQIAAAAVTASIGMLILSFVLDLSMAPYRVHQRLTASLDKSNSLLEQIVDHEPVFETLSKLHSDGKRIYYEIVDIISYKSAFDKWNDDVSSILRENFTVSERHEYISSGSGSQYVIKNSDATWLKETEQTRIIWTARLTSLNSIIRFGSPNFMGPKTEIRDLLSNRSS